MKYTRTLSIGALLAVLALSVSVAGCSTTGGAPNVGNGNRDYTRTSFSTSNEHILFPGQYYSPSTF